MPGTPILRIAGRETVRQACQALNRQGRAGHATSCTSLALAVGLTAPACHKSGLGGDGKPVEPTGGPPFPVSQIVYNAAAGASDAMGGSTVACLPYSGWAPVAVWRLRGPVTVSIVP